MMDTDLVRRLIDGDNAAFRELVDAYQTLVYRTCYHLLRQPEDAEDIAQDVFIEVFESIGQFRYQSKLSTWLYRIAINKSLNHLRKNRWRSMLSSVENFFGGEKNNNLDVEDTSVSNFPHNIDYKERSEILQSAIASLSDNQRVAFTLNKFDDLSYQEISEILNLSLSSVESLIHRAKLNMQKRLINYYKE
jgi:RNA polymerase sigma-70 factor, ECF subfamily